MKISESVALVAGGASGLGRAAAQKLAEAGARVLVFDRDPVGEAVADGLDGGFVAGDVTDTRSVVTAVEAARQLGPLRAVVNCAGVPSGERTVGRDGTYHSAHDLDAFERVVRVNLCGTFNVCRIAATAIAMLEPDETGERGAIVNTASVAAFDGQIGQTAYSSSKGGIVSLTLPLARDLAVLGIRVNAIAPGTFETPIYDTYDDPEAMKQRLAKAVLFPKRMGFGDEFASMVQQLLENTYMNAEVVRLDAGLRLPPRS